MDADEARALREAVRELLEKRSGVRAAMEMPQGYDEDLWARLRGQIGVAALAAPEDYGGVGAGLGGVAVVLENWGVTSLRPRCWARHCAPARCSSPKTTRHVRGGCPRSPRAPSPRWRGRGSGAGPNPPARRRSRLGNLLRNPLGNDWGVRWGIHCGR